MEAPAHLRWYANLFTAQRVQYILATNAASPYSVAWYGRGITDDSDFISRFRDRLREQMNADGLGFMYQRCIHPYGGTITLLKTEDRAVLGSMNDMVRACKFALAVAERNPDELSTRINDPPYSALDYGVPIEVIQKLPVETAK